MNLKKMKALDALALQGPWYAGSHRMDYRENEDEYIEVPFCSHPYPDSITVDPNGNGTDVVNTGSGEYAHHPESLLYMAHLRNLAPELLAIWEELELMRPALDGNLISLLDALNQKAESL